MIYQKLKRLQLTVQGDYENHTQEPTFPEYREAGYTLGLVDYLPLSLLKISPKIIRSNSQSLDGLAKSIEEKGLLHPIIVRHRENYYEIIAGQRRYNACKLLKWRKIACHIVELNDKDAFELSLIENVQRETLDPVDEAVAYKKYVEEYGWGSIADLAQRIGKSSSHISKRINMLSLPSDVIDRIRLREIGPSLAEELLRVEDPKTQSEIGRLISRRHLSLRQTRSLIDIKDSNFETDVIDRSASSQKSMAHRGVRELDKLIIALRLALSKVDMIMEELQDNWIIYELVSQHRNMLHAQIDLLLKEKNTLSKPATIHRLCKAF